MSCHRRYQITQEIEERMETLNPTERHIAARHIAGAAAHQVDRVMSVIFWCTFAIGVASVTAIALFLYSLAANLPSI